MKKLLVFIFISFQFTFIGNSQSYLENFPEDLLTKANTAKNINYLTDDEKLVILIINLARLDGPLFVENILNNQNNNFSSDNLNSLKNDLSITRDLEPFQPSKGLCKAAEYHAKDMGSNGNTGHISNDGTTFGDRIRKFGKGGYLAENCSYGFSDALAIVLQLLIDEGVPSLGHRKNILSTNYQYVGISIQPHAAYGSNCVQDFSDTGD